MIPNETHLLWDSTQHFDRVDTTQGRVRPHPQGTITPNSQPVKLSWKSRVPS